MSNTKESQAIPSPKLPLKERKLTDKKKKRDKKRKERKGNEKRRQTTVKCQNLGGI